jgi:hypothetical protein
MRRAEKRLIILLLFIDCVGKSDALMDMTCNVGRLEGGWVIERTGWNFLARRISFFPSFVVTSRV